MIVTCASCLTKFSLDDARVPSKGAKVRCSRCQHVFYVVPPPETKEEVIEDFESFAKYHEGLMESARDEQIEIPKVSEVQKEATPQKEVVSRQAEPGVPLEGVSEKRPEPEVLKPKEKGVSERKKGPSLLIYVTIILILLILGLYCLWSEFGQGDRFSSFIQYPIQKITDLWNQIWGL